MERRQYPLGGSKPFLIPRGYPLMRGGSIEATCDVRRGRVPVRSVSDDGGDLHGRLVARVAECWARLEDAVSELYALHEFDEQAIVEHVRSTISTERLS
jgi:hypothetical protein